MAVTEVGVSFSSADGHLAPDLETTQLPRRVPVCLAPTSALADPDAQFHQPGGAGHTRQQAAGGQSVAGPTALFISKRHGR